MSHLTAAELVTTIQMPAFYSRPSRSCSPKSSDGPQACPRRPSLSSPWANEGRAIHEILTTAPRLGSAAHGLSHLYCADCLHLAFLLKLAESVPTVLLLAAFYSPKTCNQSSFLSYSFLPDPNTHLYPLSLPSSQLDFALQSWRPMVPAPMATASNAHLSDQASTRLP